MYKACIRLYMVTQSIITEKMTEGGAKIDHVTSERHLAAHFFNKVCQSGSHSICKVFCIHLFVYYDCEKELVQNKTFPDKSGQSIFLNAVKKIDSSLHMKKTTQFLGFNYDTVKIYDITI